MRFIVRESPIEGVGLFTKQDIPKGKVLFKAGHIIVKPDKKECHEVLVTSLINHSYSNNCTLFITPKGEIGIKTVRDIHNGEEITIDYRVFERILKGYGIKTIISRANWYKPIHHQYINFRVFEINPAVYSWHNKHSKQSQRHIGQEFVTTT